MIFKLNNFQKVIKKNNEMVVLFLLIFITVITTKFYNDNKKEVNKGYKNVINNIYFQKTINNIFDNLSPGYKNIEHKISKDETFDKILKNYSIDKEEIKEIKESISGKININKLNTSQKIQIKLDLTLLLMKWLLP